LRIENELLRLVPDVRTSSRASTIPEETLSGVSRYMLDASEAANDPIPVKGALVTLIFAGSAKEEATRLVTLPNFSKS
jgi:hypothetical protein